MAGPGLESESVVTAPEDGRKRPAAHRRLANLAFAGLMFLLALLGVVLPILPTTPFLLLTSWFLVRSSPRLNEKLHRAKLFGPLLRDWERNHGVRLHVKVTAIAVMTLAVTASLVFGDLPPIGVAFLFALAGLGLVVVLRLKLIREE